VEVLPLRRSVMFIERRRKYVFSSVGATSIACRCRSYGASVWSHQTSINIALLMERGNMCRNLSSTVCAASALIVSKKQRKLDIQIGLQWNVRRNVISPQGSLIKPFEHPIREHRGNGELDSWPYTQL